ncbi:MAG TPA: type 4a pilus biogenesis protein PilO [Candidatus Cloacimonadota bacterium]|nr:type 4a pilus biogenesis protein PilO [Candidatus Cloacimonadota bacterium]HPS38507.1 type 4a pilus biogenesis protein PilO [Candidatus Cloacimonadota bacterium]
MRERYYILILLIILSSVIFLMIGSNSLHSNLRKIEQYDKKIKTAQEKLNSSKILEEQLSQFALIIDNSLTKDSAFSFDEINQFKTRIGEIANQSAISINRLSDSNKFSQPGLIECTYNMELEANYVQVGQFISAIESMDNLIKIHALDISPAQTTNKQEVSTGPNRYKVTIELSVFKVKKEV